MNKGVPPREQYQFRPTRHVPASDQDRVDLRLVLSRLMGRKWVILLCIGVSGGIAAGILQTVRPSYSSFTEALLNTRQERVVGVDHVVSDLNVTNSVVAGEIAVLRSNILLGRVVDRLNLMEHPDYNPYISAGPSLLDRAVETVKVSVARLAGRVPEPAPEAADGDGVLSAADARNIVIWKVRRDLSAAQGGISYVIQISMRAPDPQIAAAIANAVAEQYIEDQLEIKLVATRRAIQWLDTRLGELELQLRAAEDAVVEFLASQALNGEGNAEGISQQLAELNRSIVVARSDRASAQVRLDHVRKLMAEGGPAAAAEALTSPRLVSLDAERAELERQIAQRLATHGPEHPQMRDLRAAMKDVMRDQTAAIRAAIGELEATLAQSVGRQNAIEATINAAQLRQVELSRDSVRLRQLERSASAMRHVYESFLARFQETTQQLEFQRADVRIITRAEPALTPSRPRTRLIMAVALVLGAIVGIATAFILEVMNRTVRGSAELARATGLPVLAALPRVRRFGKGAGWQLAELRRKKVSPYAENLRLLRAALLNPRLEARPRVVMITSAEPGAGCSTTALGLARVVAALGQRVVLVDANFRNPSLHTLLRLQSRKVGVADYVAGNAPRSEIVIEEFEPRISVIPAWQQRSDAADLLSTGTFQSLLTDLAGEYEMVVINSAPTMGLADAKVLAGLTDAVVLMARNGASTADALSAATNAIDEAGGVLVGAVLSRADRSDRTSSASHGAEWVLEGAH